MSRMIYLIRHAEPVQLSSKKSYLGQLNPPLSPNGCNQAAKLSDLLQNRKLNAIFCSDLTRATQTAAIIAQYHDCKPVCLKELREVNLGVWDGLPMAEVKTKHPDLYAERGKDIVYFRPPGGESFADVQERVIPAFENVLLSTAGNIAIVAHAGVNRIILSYLQELDLTNLFSIKQSYTQIHIILQSAAGFRIRERT